MKTASLRWQAIGGVSKAGFLVVVCLAILSACSDQPDAGSGTGAPNAISSYGKVDEVRLARADDEPSNWYTNGRDANGSYFSPLSRINATNVSRLGYAWSYDLGTARGQEATPLVVDGVLYAVGNWGRVYALDAKTGRRLWEFVPKIDGQYGRYACCDVVQRGLQVWKGKVYAGATDGYLHALDAGTGRVVWRADTLPPEARAERSPYTSSGSPQIAGSLVVVGNGGADFGVRGFVTAFDLETGKLAWRFYTVPRDPALGPQEAPHLDAALKTWDPNGSWTRHGGGGTVWDGMAYDPNLDLLYIGTGNGAPYNYRDRSPKGGDNLYLASILAIRARNGTLAWHFQEVPGEHWDYTATQKFILADITVDGRMRQVIMQAPKNGFFYVLDRVTGEFLSAKPFVAFNWTRGLDDKGRPSPAPEADYDTGPKLVYPTFAGGHNWPPMSRDPRTGLVYIPTYEDAVVMVESSRRPIGSVPGQFTTYPVAPDIYESEEVRMNLGALPPLERLTRKAPPGLSASRTTLKAIDPLTGRIMWQEQDQQFMASGIMTTAAGLVFNGRADGSLRILASDNGKLLKRIETGSSILAAPMTYAVEGTQYVAVITGYGGGGGFSFPSHTAAYRYGNRNRILAFKLDGGAVPIPQEMHYPPIPEPIPWSANAGELESGRRLYIKYCSSCHSFGPGLVPDLRRLTEPMHALFDDIVLRGILVQKGMGRFDDVLTPEDTRAIHGYIIEQARIAAREQATEARTPGFRRQ